MAADALIQMEGIKKVFLTEEVETHALSDVHLNIAPGEFVSIAGPSAQRQRCVRLDRFGARARP